jgi:hypothetical protein
VCVTARLQKINHSEQFLLNYWLIKCHEDLMNKLWGRNWWRDLTCLGTFSHLPLHPLH